MAYYCNCKQPLCVFKFKIDFDVNKMARRLTNISNPYFNLSWKRKNNILQQPHNFSIHCINMDLENIYIYIYQS